MLHQTQCIIIFDFFYADHSILKPGIATQHNILNLVLAAIQITSESLVGRGNKTMQTGDSICNFKVKVTPTITPKVKISHVKQAFCPNLKLRRKNHCVFAIL